MPPGCLPGRTCIRRGLRGEAGLGAGRGARAGPGHRDRLQSPPVGIAAWAAAAWYKTRTAAGSVEPGPAQSYEPARLTFDTEDTDQPEIPEAEPSEAAEGGRPVYKTWWFWAAVGGAAVVAAVLAAIGGDSGEDLPDFRTRPTSRIVRD